MATNVQSQEIKVYRGEDVSLDFTATTDTDITDWAITFTLRLPGASPTLTLTTSGGEVTLTDEDAGELSVALTRAQTAALTSRQYRWDLWRTDTGSYRRLAGGDYLSLTPELPTS